LQHQSFLLQSNYQLILSLETTVCSTNHKRA
jgi:hypothetical protein